MKNIVNYSSITVLIVGVVFLFVTLFVPQPATAKPRRQAPSAGETWGNSCWAEVKKGLLDQNWALYKGKKCMDNNKCLNCCSNKHSNCRRRYPNRGTKCFHHEQDCFNSVRPARLGGSGLQRPPSGKVKRTPRRSRFQRRAFNIQEFMLRFQLRSRGIENLPPPVNPDPEPPTLPNFEIQKDTP